MKTKGDHLITTRFRLSLRRDDETQLDTPEATVRSWTQRGGGNMQGLGRCSAALLLFAGVAQSGCSWIFMSRAPDPVPVPTAPVDCTTSRAAPILDTICSAYFVANGVVLAASQTCPSATGGTCFDQGTKVAGIITSAALAGVCGFSAAAGFGYANRCEETKEVNGLCISGNERACLKLNPDWSPPRFVPGAPAQPPAPPPVAPPPETPAVPPPSGPSPPSATRVDLFDPAAVARARAEQ